MALAIASATRVLAAALALALAGLLLLDVAASRAANTRPEVVRDLRLVREAREALATEPSRLAAYPALRFLAPLLGKSNEPQLAAIRELAQLGLPAAAFVLLDVIGRREFPHRSAAIRALAAVAHPAALDGLMRLLDDPDPEIRRTAARTLGRVGLKTVERDVPIGPVSERLKQVLSSDPVPEVRVAALDAMVMLGTTESLVAGFEVAIRDSAILVRCSVLGIAASLARHYGSLKPMRVARALAPARSDADGAPVAMGVVRRAWSLQQTSALLGWESPCSDPGLEALRRLAEVRAPEVFVPLLRAAAAEDSGLRAVAIAGLANYRRPEALPTIVTGLADPIRGVRRAAITALAEMDTAAADRQLAHALSGALPRPDGAVRLGEDDRRQLVTALAGPWETLSLIEPLAGGSAQVRRAAAQSLLGRETGLAERVEALGELARRGARGPERTRLEREVEIWRREQRLAEVALVEALDSLDERMRARAGYLLAATESQASFEGLLEALRSGSHRRREAAARALGLRGDAAARSPLETAARSENRALALAAIRALQDLGQAASLPVLRTLAESQRAPSLAEALASAIAMLEAGRLEHATATTRHADDL